MAVRTARSGALVALLAVLSFSACQASASFGGPTVETEALENQVSAELAEVVGFPPDRVECPGPLDGEVGNTMTCQLFVDEDHLDVTVTVTAVEGDLVSFDVVVAEQ